MDGRTSRMLGSEFMRVRSVLVRFTPFWSGDSSSLEVHDDLVFGQFSHRPWEGNTIHQTPLGSYELRVDPRTRKRKTESARARMVKKSQKVYRLFTVS